MTLYCPFSEPFQMHRSLQHAAHCVCTGGYAVVNVLAGLPPCEVDVKLLSLHWKI